MDDDDDDDDDGVVVGMLEELKVEVVVMSDEIAEDVVVADDDELSSIGVVEVAVGCSLAKETLFTWIMEVMVVVGSALMSPPSPTIVLKRVVSPLIITCTVGAIIT